MNETYRRAAPEFFVETASAKKILAIEVAGLGDLVHSLPALWAIRQAYPRAELHCLVRAQYASLLRFTPWIDVVWPWRRGSTNPLEYLRAARALRKQNFDLSIDFMGSEYSSITGWVAGAGRRLVRKPGTSKKRYCWRRLATEILELPHAHEPIYQQRWFCLQQAGIVSASPQFRLSPDGLMVSPFDTTEAKQAYIHISPYTKLSRKELPPADMALLISRLQNSLPQLRVVISCSGQARELRALEQLLAALPIAPWKVFAGTLDIPQLFSLIKGASLHLSGDTGAMHLAWLAGTASVSWFSPHVNHRAWAPRGSQHAVAFSATGPGEYLFGVSIDELVAHAQVLCGVMTKKKEPEMQSSNPGEPRDRGQYEVAAPALLV